MQYLQGQLKTAKENELFAKTIRHDFRHHNQNIAAMLQRGETAEALRYIEQYNESLDTAMPKEFCPHVTVNAILSSFYTKAQNDGICVSVKADVQEETAVSDMDFVAILSNLLENAINGCKECGAKGEVPVSVSYGYTPATGTVSGGFTDGAAVIIAPVALPAAEEQSAWLILNGKPTQSLRKAVLGTVTVTIGGD